MSEKIIPMKNDGMNDISYEFGDNEAENQRISSILNEAVHVFRYHADGNWKNIYKPKYSSLLAAEIKRRPSLIKMLKALKDPVVSNLTYSAIEFNKANDAKNS